VRSGELSSRTNAKAVAETKNASAVETKKARVLLRAFFFAPAIPASLPYRGIGMWM
jgi:hypothetical protein